MAPRLLQGEQPDVTYYGVVRSTLTSVDGQRLTSSINGTTIPLTILAGAATISHYFMNWIGYMLGAYLCLIAALIAGSFLAKIDLFNHFIKESVEIGTRIEDILALDSNICLTKGFEKHAKAGGRGDRLFKISIYLVGVTAIVGLFAEIIMAILLVT